MDTLKVRDAKDVEQVVRAAIASEQPLEIVGHGSKRLVGQPMATNGLLELSALNAVTAYEPNELIITVQAGAPLADVLPLQRLATACRYRFPDGTVLDLPGEVEAIPAALDAALGLAVWMR